MKAPKWYIRLSNWVEGDAPTLEEPKAYVSERPAVQTGEYKRHMGPGLIRTHGTMVPRVFTNAIAVLCCILFTILMITTVAYLPAWGDEANPTNNETAQRYIESGIEEVGATNLVTNIMLVYRGFDTFGESCVLFLGATAVIMLLATDKNNTSEYDLRLRAEDLAFDKAQENQILRHITTLLMPIALLYGLYVLFNGHLSPGGGFAGGSILGGALILCENAFGSDRVHSFFGHSVYHAVKVGALILYAILIGYTIFVGANGLTNIIPLGTPGSILSAGIILPINVAVGLEVACTMYAFYAYFSKGDL